MPSDAARRSTVPPVAQPHDRELHVRVARAARATTRTHGRGPPAREAVAARDEAAARARTCAPTARRDALGASPPRRATASDGSETRTRERGVLDGGHRAATLARRGVCTERTRRDDSRTTAARARTRAASTTSARVAAAGAQRRRGGGLGRRVAAGLAGDPVEHRVGDRQRLDLDALQPRR